MNYARPELRDLLAGEYVLGQLHGGALRRFERLLLSDATVGQAVADWERRLAPLAESLPAVMPRRRVWRRIRRRIEPPRRSRLFLRSGWIAATATAAAFVAVLGLYLARPVAPTAPTEVAVISSTKGAPQWVVTVRGKRLRLRAVGSAAAPAGKSYQLWMLPGGGAKPVSLGLLPASGVASEVLTPAQVRALAGAGGLAVSVEPAGGSPTGLPTGPVVFQAALVST